VCEQIFQLQSLARTSEPQGVHQQIYILATVSELLYVFPDKGAAFVSFTCRYVAICEQHSFDLIISKQHCNFHKIDKLSLSLEVFHTQMTRLIQIRWYLKRQRASYVMTHRLYNKALEVTSLHVRLVCFNTPWRQANSRHIEQPKLTIWNSLVLLRACNLWANWNVCVTTNPWRCLWAVWWLTGWLIVTSISDVDHLRFLDDCRRRAGYGCSRVVSSARVNGYVRSLAYSTHNRRLLLFSDKNSIGKLQYKRECTLFFFTSASSIR
jgi:hypothetical protein